MSLSVAEDRWQLKLLVNPAVAISVEIVNHQHLWVDVWHSMFPVHTRYTLVLTAQHLTSPNTKCSENITNTSHLL